MVLQRARARRVSRVSGAWCGYLPPDFRSQAENVLTAAASARSLSSWRVGGSDHEKQVIAMTPSAASGIAPIAVFQRVGARMKPMPIGYQAGPRGDIQDRSLSLQPRACIVARWRARR